MWNNVFRNASMNLWWWKAIECCSQNLPPPRICPGDKIPPRNMPTLHSWALKLSDRDVIRTRHGPEDKRKEQPLEGRSLWLLVGMTRFELAPPPAPEAVAFASLTVRLPTREEVIQGRFLEDVQRKFFQKHITGSMTILVWAERLHKKSPTVRRWSVGQRVLWVFRR